MNAAVTILTSVVVSAVVASVFNLLGQAAERRARHKELIFLKSLELAKANREFIAMVADKTGQKARIADYVVYAEMYHWLLNELHDKGSLPDDWQEKTKKMMESTFGKDYSLVFKWDRTGIDARASEILSSPDTKQISAPSSVRWDKVADLFWLGNDLEWTVQTLLRGAPKERIFHGLRQCDHHSSELGLADSGPGKQISAFKSQVDGLPEAALDRQWRNDFVEKMYLVIKGFDSLVKQHQPDFRPGPER